MVYNKRAFVVMPVVEVFNRNVILLQKNIFFHSLFSYGILGMNSKLLSETVIA